jgi:hypothetical protein
MSDLNEPTLGHEVEKKALQSQEKELDLKILPKEKGNEKEKGKKKKRKVEQASEKENLYQPVMHGGGMKKPRSYSNTGSKMPSSPTEKKEGQKEGEEDDEEKDEKENKESEAKKEGKVEKAEEEPNVFNDWILFQEIDAGIPTFKMRKVGGAFTFQELKEIADVWKDLETPMSARQQELWDRLFTHMSSEEAYDDDVVPPDEVDHGNLKKWVPSWLFVKVYPVM